MDRPADRAPIPVPPAQRREEFRTRRLPALVWGAAVLVLVLVGIGRQSRQRSIAIAQARDYEISVSRDGTLALLGVALYDTVEPGAVIATLDDPELDGLLAVSEATVQQLRSEIAAARASHRADSSRTLASWETDRRRFQMDEENRRLDALALRIEFETARVEEERQALEVRRTRSLYEAGLVSESQYEAARLLHQEVRQRVAETERLLAQTQEEIQASGTRRRDYEQAAPRTAAEDPVLQPFTAAVDVELRRLADLKRQRETLVLRSPVAGQVSQLLCRDGQAVVAGEPIAVVTERSVQEIVAYLSGPDAREVAVASKVELSSRARGIRGESVVVRVGDSIQPLPPRLWRDPRMPVYGRAVVIAPLPGLELVPGELLDARFGVN